MKRRRRIIVPVESGLMLAHIEKLKNDLEDRLPDFEVIVISGMAGNATVID